MEFLAVDVMGKPVWAWLGFLAVVFILLAFDLGVLHRRPHVIGARESLILSAFYIAAGLLFSVWIYSFLGSQKAAEYLTGFLVEKSLAMDNIFVIASIFAYFSIPREFQHRVLVYGILGVIILRGILIGLGTAIVSEFAWVLDIFAVFLIIVGIKMMLTDDDNQSLENNRILRFLRRHLYVTDNLHGDRFFVRQPMTTGGKTVLFVTPLLIALVMIELADVLFAVDSIPAVFAITVDPYVVFTSNIFAILGLRALYFALSAVLARFAYLKYALALVLVFIGGKVLASSFLGIEEVPPEFSLFVTVAILGGGVAYSLYRTRREASDAPSAPVVEKPHESRP